MSSGRVRRRTYHAESFDKRANVVVANGTPLSLRMRGGSPYSLNSRVKIGLASSTAVDRCGVGSRGSRGGSVQVWPIMSRCRGARLGQQDADLA